MAQRITAGTYVYGLKGLAEPQISPDGATIVYTISTLDEQTKKGSAQIWACDRDGGRPRQLTFAGEHNTGARWSPDGSRVAFISDRVKSPAKAGIFVLPVDQPGEARELTTHNQAISELVWSPDGKTIAYVTSFDPENPDEEPPKEDEPAKVRVTRRFDYKQDGRGYLGNVRHHIWLVDVESGERRRVTRELVDHGGAAWSPDGKSLAVRMQAPDGWSHCLAILDIASGEIRRAGNIVGSQPRPAWSPNGDRIIFTGDPSHTYQSDLYVYDVASGETHQLTNDPPMLPTDARPVWLDERDVLFAAAEHARHGLYVIDTESGNTERLASFEASRMGLSVDAERRYAVQAHSSFEAADEIAVYDLREHSSSLVSRNNVALLERIGTAGWERFTVERGGFSIESLLVKPADFDPAKQYPVVMIIHGGPNSFHGYRFAPNQQLFTQHGFLVVLPNPRGSTSYGREFSVQVLGDRGGEDYLDLMAVADEIATHPYVDESRFAIYGYSYGGFMTAWMLGQTDRFKACVCGAPSVDLKSQFGTSDIGWHYDTTQYRAQPHEKPEWYVAHSPLTFAHRATTPTMLVSGESDLRCPTSQAEEMFVALKKAGCEVQFVRYPGMAHGFAGAGPAQYREDFLNRSVEWIERHLGAGR